PPITITSYASLLICHSSQYLELDVGAAIPAAISSVQTLHFTFRGGGPPPYPAPPQRLKVDQETGRIFQRFLDRHEEQHRILAVDDAVVVGNCDVHHRSNLHLAVHDHRAFLNLVHAEDRTLRRVDDRRGEQRAEHAAVRDGKRA